MELLIILIVFAIGLLAICAFIIGGAAFIFKGLGKMLRKLTDKKE